MDKFDGQHQLGMSAAAVNEAGKKLEVNNGTHWPHWNMGRTSSSGHH